MRRPFAPCVARLVLPSAVLGLAVTGCNLASLANLTGTSQTVSSIQLAADSLIGDSLPVVAGDTATVSATAIDAEGQPVPGTTFEWTSSDTTVATVSSTGLVTAVDVGEADIDIAVASGSGSATMATGTLDARHRASSPITPRGAGGTSRIRVFVVPHIVLTPQSASIDVHQTATFTAAAVDRHGNQRWGSITPTWQSSNTGIATVATHGGTSATATGVNYGTTTIVATATVQSRHSLGPMSGLATLNVAQCGGVTAVKSWTLSSFTTTYKPPTTAIDGGNYTIDEASTTATATLTPNSPPSPDSATWWVPITGTATVNNAFIAPNGAVTITETTAGGEAPLRTGSTLRLIIKPQSSGGCRYFLRYANVFTFSINGGGGASPGPGGVVALVLDPVPSASGGVWTLSGTDGSVDAVDNATLFTPLTGYYTPATDFGQTVAAHATTTATISWSLRSN